MAERAQIVVKGVVQGVGFRPYVYSLAETLGLKGYVTNTAEGVLIDVEGDGISLFIQRLKNQAPPLSQITDVSVQSLPLYGYPDFTIRSSTDQTGNHPFTLVSPDVSVCDDCLRELLDPSDRRYLYPFINCTNCGPRYSLTTKVPYDRPNTTMAGFTMCPDCLREYQYPGNRRFHAQPNACPVCGPRVEFRVAAGFSLRGERGMRSAESGIMGGDAIRSAIMMLKDGGIVAVKGIGGFHIACDATNDEAVGRLREKKRKSNKPFAVMAPSLEAAGKFCMISEEEEKLLLSNRRPVVLLHKREGHSLPDSVSPANQYIGCLLPYTPLHYLLFHQPLEAGSKAGGPHFDALVMTSGNLSEEPIVRDNDAALRKLSAIVDGFLLHDRDIFMRVDDSVIRLRHADSGIRNESQGLSSQSEICFLRRSRGYAPDPIMLPGDGPEVLGCGADLKNTLTLTKGGFAIPSQHIGDMENYETVKFFEESLANLKAVYRAEPVAIAHDLHPGYLSTRWALEQVSSRSAIRLYGVQHHYAHIASVMAEHGLKEPVIGVAFDGTGYGTDGNLWGGEFLIVGINGFERAGSLRYVALPGGEAAIREPWKTAVSYIMDAAGDRAVEYLHETGFIQRYGRDTIEKLMIVARSREFSPLSSGAGRLFDAVSALLGICDCNTFEGEAAMALESFAREGCEDEYQVEFKEENEYTVVDFSPTIMGVIHDLRRAAAREIMTTKFHNTVASVIRVMAAKLSGRYACKDVALSGGTFQNQYLLKRTMRLLSSAGLKVYTNRKVPCNDGGISLGQAYLVRESLRKHPLPSVGEGRGEGGVH